MIHNIKQIPDKDERCESLVPGSHYVPVINPKSGFFMMRKAHNRIEYQKGELIGECIYIIEAEPYISPKGKIIRKALFECGNCGNEFTTQINHVKRLVIKSCGCMNNGQWNKTHGLSKHPLFAVWSTMKARCYNHNKESYHRYGGRGITVCDEWKNDFTLYYNYVVSLPNAMMDGYTIDRKDNDGNYEPWNVRWATMKEQSNNRSNNIKK